MRVLIVGAGIAGHTLACALTRRDIECDIVELRSNWEIIGAGMYVQNNALRALDDIGVATTVVERGWHSPDDASIFADLNGDEIARATIPPCPGSRWPGTNPLKRAVLHDILHEATEAMGIVVQMARTVDSIGATDGSGLPVIRFSDGEEDRYDLVVGADGIRSRIRKLLFPQCVPVYSGFANWRVVLPRPSYLERVLWQLGDETSVGLIPISDDEIYLAGVTKEPGNPWFGQDQLLSLLHARFAEYGGPAAEMLGRIESPRQVVYTPVEEVLLPRPWSKGRIVVLGDAAHASTPFWAQGAAMAIEDCILLAELLSRRGLVTEVLEEWERRRFDRCRFVQHGSKQAGESAHRPMPLKEKYDHIRQHVQSETDRRYLAMYEEF